MLYTDKSIRFADSEIAAYRAEGVDVTQITTYRQFVQMIRQQRRNQQKERVKMAKRFGRRALNGTMEYYDSRDECLAAQRHELADIRMVFFGIVGTIAGGILTYMLLRQMPVDSRIIRFIAVIVGAWFCGIVGAALSDLLWIILKLTLILTTLVVISLLMWMYI